MFAHRKRRVETAVMTERKADWTGRRARSDEADAVLAACRLLVAISVQSLATVEDQVDLTQLRILVVVGSRGSTTLSGLATAARLHLSRASRACDRLVALGLLERADDPADRRNLRLTLTERGEAIVATVARARREALRPILAKMSRQSRAQLIPLLEEFTKAGGEPHDVHLWALGWAT
jgi:DNA-binding MarR family transcriptional regulator